MRCCSGLVKHDCTGTELPFCSVRHRELKPCPWCWKVVWWLCLVLKLHLCRVKEALLSEAWRASE